MSLETKLTDNINKMTGVRPKVDVVYDVPYKERFVTNSFFFTGHFEKEHTVNYLLHLMTWQIPGTPSTMTYCFSVTDETTGEYYQESIDYPIEQVTLDEGRFLVAAPNGKMEGDMDEILLTAKMDKGEIELTLNPVGFPLYNAETGTFHMLDMDIQQYSIPKIKTSGKLVINGVEYDIKPEDGWSWFDRQWQRELPKSKAMRAMIGKMLAKQEFVMPKWGWTNLNFDNGEVLSTWFADEKSGEIAWGTVMHPDGTQKKVKIDPIISTATDYWKSPDSPWAYPMKYSVVVPELDIDVTVTCSPKEQELVFEGKDIYSHYEGASTFEGTYAGEPTKGFCVMELIGPWKEN